MIGIIPSIITNYSGNKDYADENNSFLVPFDLVSVNESGGYHMYTKESKWAEPDIDKAIESIISVIKRDKSYKTIKKNLDNFKIDNKEITKNQIKTIRSQFFS